MSKLEKHIAIIVIVMLSISIIITGTLVRHDELDNIKAKIFSTNVENDNRYEYTIGYVIDISYGDKTRIHLKSHDRDLILFYSGDIELEKYDSVKLKYEFVSSMIYGGKIFHIGDIIEISKY